MSDCFSLKSSLIPSCIYYRFVRFDMNEYKSKYAHVGQSMDTNRKYICADSGFLTLDRWIECCPPVVEIRSERFTVFSSRTVSSRPA